MSEIVGRLCREHRNIGALLDMLERMVDGLESGSDAPGDVGLMRDIMTYMTRFPDHTHHPMEDLMFQRMRARGLTPQTEDTIGQLLREHAERAFEERTDPVFGPRVDSEFRALYQHIKNTAYLRERGAD